jgi:hypothetical protein
MTLKHRFQQFEEDFCCFVQVENPRCGRPDLNAFLLLDELLPGQRDLVCAASHDEIWLDVDLKALTKVITDEQILELVRCGVRLDSKGLCMFV